ncbi:Cytochrome oxidase biogenesis protein Sco1/SenC/PrrC, putative copper metallochaperone [Acidisarcina polymorpha]|uniref:Cytochrome oxidase biogenesis protein Sco1/SenC/PrrC, putative copper metallochaperone n=1 Tax=Acidisarcina polymorpha TaxID=2211140 RepID=A0A2Z5FVX8_9BACT|nr:SCO family protein [Acidisarcina polymorpha]AXC10991.1 Cytochrome oxidase biogenesis protein Sco1/SenC/PrrC, putative copper metallochaperone [Acidisarcina polymorpha]
MRSIAARFLRPRSAAAALLSVAGLLLSLPASAQVSSYGDKQMGEVAVDHPSPILSKVFVHQHLDQQIPLQGVFRDETGASVKMGDYFGKRPVILAIVYYACPMLCSEEMNGLVGALEMVKFRPGKDFDIVAISIDPSEGPELAAKKKAMYLKRYAHPETADGWHFLTGQQPAINAVADAVGFGYARVPGPDGHLSQFAHASSIQILTPEGKLAQYYMGVEYSPKDLQLGLVEASHNKIGSPVDNILTYCYRYDPDLNRHSLVVARVVQLGGMLTMLSLGSFMVVMFRRDLKQGEPPSYERGDRRRQL